MLAQEYPCLLIGFTFKDDALTSFNQIMLMETFALADNTWQSSLRSDLNPYETYKTRLVRVDLPCPSGSRDLLRHYLRKGLRIFWFFICHGGSNNESQPHTPYASATKIESNNAKRSFQNTARLADFLTRFIIAVLSGGLLVVPLIFLSKQTSSEAQLVLVSIFIVTFSLLVSLLSKASNQETMAASAAYAAVLVVFIANTPAT